MFHRLRRRWSRRDTVILFVGLVVLAGAGLPLPGYSVAPGQTKDARDLIVVRDQRVFMPAGSFLVSTVALRPLSPFIALQAWLDDDIRTVPKHRVQGKRDRTVALEKSEAVAIAVALDRLGFAVRRTGGGARVEKVNPGSPAQGRLMPGDVIAAVNGVRTSSSQEVITVLNGLEAGAVVRLRVEGPDGRSRTEEITLGRRAGTRQPLLGVALRTAPSRFQFPIKVVINAGAIDGPSAGLAFTLAVLDVLTPGELTGKNRVAVTGTIDIHGNVGKVGSVTEKAAAARRAGARYFLVPSGQAEEARRGGGPKVKVISVSTLDGTLTALEALGGDAGVVEPRPS